jgi:hypothetical protein
MNFSEQFLEHAERSRRDGAARAGIHADGRPLQPARPCHGSGIMDDAESGRPSGQDRIAWENSRAPSNSGKRTEFQYQPAGASRIMGHPASESGMLSSEYSGWGISSYASGILFAPGPSSPLWPDILAASPHLAPALSIVEAALALAVQQGEIHDEAEIGSRFHGLVDGLARRVVERKSRLQCCGNGVVALCAAACFAELARRMNL